MRICLSILFVPIFACSLRYACDMQLARSQKRLGPRSLLACILVINTTLILAIDMYVPALPQLLEQFDTNAAFLNLTIFMFMLVSAFAILIAGPLTDRFGRKPVLVASCAIFALSSLGCAFSSSVLMLTAFRIGQAIGFGLVETDATALIKDAYADKDLKFAMSLLQSLVIIGPVLAPFLGTFILTFVGWRGIFAVLAACGAMDLALSLLITETIRSEQRLAEGVGSAMRDMLGRIGSLLHDRKFMSMAFVVGLAGLPYMGYIAVASYILFDDFGASYFVFNLVYGGTCAISVIAPFVYLRASKSLSPSVLTAFCIAMGIAGAVLTWFFGALGPLAIFLAFAPYALMEGIIRPHAFVILVDQPPEKVASASAFSNFVYSVLGAAGTVVMTLPWATYVGGLAIVMMACSVLMLLLFVFGLRR